MLFDDVLRDIKENSAPHASQLVGIMKQATIIHAQNVLAYYALQIQDEDGFNKQLGAQIPPFSHMWLEYNCPATIIIDGEMIDWPRWGFRRAGVFLQTTDRKDEDPRWLVKYAMFWEFSEEVLVIPAGNYTHYPMLMGEFSLQTDGTNPDNTVGFYEDATRNHPPEVRELMEWSRAITVDVMLLTLTFLNCRNVSLDTVTPIAPQQTPEQRRRNSWPQPERSYHLIHIAPLAHAAARPVTSSGVPGSPQRTHIVRGHFHTYAPEKPLFGKPGLSGQFWIPQRVQGHAPGTIDTAYQIDLEQGEE